MNKQILPTARTLVFVSTFLLLIVTSKGQEPRVNVSSPFESVTYTRSDQNEVLITVKLREAKSTDALAVINRFRITSLKVISDDKRSGVVNNVSMSAESLEYNFVIPISTTQQGVGGAIFRLAPNWKSLSFGLEYEFTADGSNSSKRLNGPSFTVLRNFIEPEATRNVRTTIELPVFKDLDTVNVPIKLEDDDMVVDVDLFDSANNVVASGSDFLERSKRKIVSLKRDQQFNVTAGTQYQVRIKPRFRVEVNFSTKTRDWTAVNAPPSYTIVRESSSDLSNLKIVEVNDPFPFKVQTKGGGSLSIIVDGIGEIKPDSSPDGVHQFKITPATIRALPEGSTNFRFNGTSTLGVDLAEAGQIFKLYKDTQTRLVGVIGLKLDTLGGGKILQIDYQLSRKINSQVQIDNGTMLPATPTGGTGPYSYTAKVDINAANTLNTLQTALARSGGTTTQVKFAVTETKDGNTVEVGGFKIDAFAAPVLPQPKDKDALLSLINDAAAVVRNNPGEALVKIKTALGLEGMGAPSANDQQLMTQVIAELKNNNGQSGKAKALAIIGSIGRVALNLFGIPVPPKL